MRTLSIICLSIFLSLSVQAEDTATPEQVKFGDIDVKTQNKVFKKVSKRKSSYVKQVLAQPDAYNPTVLYALSSALFKKGDKDAATFWFYAGQLRARSDANKSLDVSARQAVSMLNQNFGAPINQYAFKDIEKLEKTISNVIAWDKSTPRNYDPRWISLHGMDAFNKEYVAFEPQEKWQEINNKTRDEYLQGFTKAMEQLKGGS